MTCVVFNREVPIFNLLPIAFLQVFEFVGLTELYYAGSHGMDIMGPVRPSSSDNKNCIRSTNNEVLIVFRLYGRIVEHVVNLSFTELLVVNRERKLTCSSLPVNSYP